MCIRDSYYQAVKTPAPSTLVSVARDLLAFRRWLFAEELDYKDCSQRFQNSLPTYKFTRHLQGEINDRRLAVSTAKRRINVVIRFYRWLQDCKIITHQGLWKITKQKVISGLGIHSFFQTHITTDLSKSLGLKTISLPRDGVVEDGRRLLPLTPAETNLLREVLDEISNTEMSLSLIHI